MRNELRVCFDAFGADMTGLHPAHDWGLGGALMVLVGSALPFVDVADEAVGTLKPDVIPNVIKASGVFGAVLVFLAYSMRRPAQRGLCGFVLFVASLLGFLFYVGFAYLGSAQSTGNETIVVGFGDVPEVLWRPGIGIWACIAGSAVACGATLVIFQAATRAARVRAKAAGG